MKRFLLLIFPLVLSAQIDTTNNGAVFGAYTATSSGTFTWNMTVGTCSSGNPFLMVWFLSSTTAGSPSVTSAFWDNAGTPLAFTHVASGDITTGSTRTFLYKLVTSVTGTKQVGVTISGGDFVIISTWNCGVDPTTPIVDFHLQDTASGISSTNPTATITSTNDNSWQMSALIGTNFNGFFSAQSCTTTIRQNIVNDNGHGQSGVIVALVSAGPKTPQGAMSCDWSTPSNNWSASTITLNPASVTPSTVAKKRIISGGE